MISHSLRAIAAVYVVLHHLSAHEIIPGHLWIFRFGQEAVILFFLLSGYAIRKATQHDFDRKQFIFRRLLRIYPLFLLSLLVAYAVNHTSEFLITELLCNIAMLQDASNLKPGTICSPFAGNGPLWSLSYEIFFYLIFTILGPSFLRLNYYKVLFLLLLASTLYTIFNFGPLLFIAYFGIWWSGYLLGEENEITYKQVMTKIMPLLLLPVIPFIVQASATDFPGFGRYPVLQIRHMVTASAFVLLYCVILKLNFVRETSNQVTKIAIFGSSISYGVYILHKPILIDASINYTLPLWMLLPALIVISWIFDRRLYNQLKKRFLQ